MLCVKRREYFDSVALSLFVSIMCSHVVNRLRGRHFLLMCLIFVYAIVGCVFVCCDICGCVCVVCCASCVLCVLCVLCALCVLCVVRCVLCLVFVFCVLSVECCALWVSVGCVLNQ